MSTSTSDVSNPQPLRLWPGVALVVLQWLARFAVPAVAPDAMPYGVMTALACAPAIILWWAFFSRAPRAERWGALALMFVALAATPRIVHPSIANGMMGMMFFIYALPILCLAFVIWAVAARGLKAGPRWATMAAAIFLACGSLAFVRTAGLDGTGDSDFAWRWTPTAEERLLAETEAVASAAPAITMDGTAMDGTPEWPGFRGPGRDGTVAGTRIATDWAATPPVEIWRRPVGPGWSSFAVDDGRFYTQEQRGDDEIVSCYDKATGEPLWQHRDAARFWESNAGAGPRGTPTLYEGRVYTLGATGIVNALDAADGTVVWTRDAAADTGAKLPDWGYSGSPLVWSDDAVDLVAVAVSGRMAAYDRRTGKPRWIVSEGGPSYSSPQRMTIGGVEQILMLNDAGIFSVTPDDGTRLWEHAWKGYPIVQPAQTADGDVLISVNANSGLRRLAITQEGDGWKVEERWTSMRLKPYFNDFVVHEGHAYGFDGSILACIRLEGGERRWKGGRYGNGQMVLLPEQDVLLVLSEKGELALVGALPDDFTELSRFPAIEGKTWNHPVLAGDVLLVRNDREMAAFRLPAANG